MLAYRCLFRRLVTWGAREWLSVVAGFCTAALHCKNPLRALDVIVFYAQGNQIRSLFQSSPIPVSSLSRRPRFLLSAIMPRKRSHAFSRVREHAFLA